MSVSTSQEYTIYNVPRRFLTGSTLHIYLSMKASDLIKKSVLEYTLYKVLLALRQVISREKLFDPTNSTVIICGRELEQALNVAAVHITEVRDHVCKQMEIIDPSLLASQSSQASLQIPQALAGPHAGSEGAEKQGESNGVGQQAKFDVEGRYWVKPKFLEVLRKVKGVKENQLVFTYRELTGYLSQYILDNKNRIFDERNIKVAIVQGDPLGRAFNVNAFHRSQVTNLLRSQLIPFEPKVHDDPLLEQEASVSSLVPTVTNAKDEPSDKRKNCAVKGSAKRPHSHKSSDDEGVNTDEGTSRASSSKQTSKRQKRFSITIYKEVNSGLEPMSDDDESIYSAQGYDTTVVADGGNETDVETVNNDDDDDYDVYDIEYEPEGATSDDEDGSRKRKAKKKGDVSSDNESDFDDVIALASVAIQLNEANSYDEADNDADRDEGMVGDDDALSTYDPENPRDSWKCLTCGIPNLPFVGYCNACYKERKGWMPDRPRPKRKNKRTAGQLVKSMSYASSSSDPLSLSSGSSSASASTLGSDASSQRESSSQESGYSSQALYKVPSSDDDEDESMKQLKKVASLSVSNPSMLCSLCCARPKNACFVHGRITHQVSCYPCAKKLYKEKKGCPVCRRKIEKITKHILA